MGKLCDTRIMMAVIVIIEIRLIFHRARIVVVASLSSAMTSWLKQIQAVFLEFKKSMIAEH
jgi:hypothetical protein